jgi:hypothetical protein
MMAAEEGNVSLAEGCQARARQPRLGCPCRSRQRDGGAAEDCVGLKGHAKARQGSIVVAWCGQESTVGASPGSSGNHGLGRSRTVKERQPGLAGQWVVSPPYGVARRGSSAKEWPALPPRRMSNSAQAALLRHGCSATGRPGPHWRGSPGVARTQWEALDWKETAAMPRRSARQPWSSGYGAHRPAAGCRAAAAGAPTGVVPMGSNRVARQQCLAEVVDVGRVRTGNGSRDIASKEWV